jgi:hypothetical protein
MGKIKILSTIKFFLGVLIAVTPFYIFPVCEFYGKMIKTEGGGYVSMVCTYTARTELILGILISFLSLFLFFSSEKESQRYLSLSLLILFSFSLLGPTYLIGMCKGPTMPCRLGTLPALLLLSGAGILLSILTFFFSLKR